VDNVANSIRLVKRDILCNPILDKEICSSKIKRQTELHKNHFTSVLSSKCFYCLQFQCFENSATFYGASYLNVFCKVPYGGWMFSEQVAVSF